MTLFTFYLQLKRLVFTLIPSHQFDLQKQFWLFECDQVVLREPAVSPVLT